MCSSDCSSCRETIFRNRDKMHFEPLFKTRSVNPSAVRRYLNPSRMRRHLHVLIGAALFPAFVAIYYLSYWLRFEGQLGRYGLDTFCATAGWVVCVKLAWFVGMRACRGWSRPVTFYDLGVLLRRKLRGNQRNPDILSACSHTRHTAQRPGARLGNDNRGCGRLALDDARLE